MAAYAEGLGILRAANVGKKTHAVDAETTPLRDPEHYQYDLNLPDVAEVWRRGSVIASWLLDLTATALLKDPALANFAGRVSDSGEGRWTIKAAIDEGQPAPVLTTALYERFSSRGEADFQAQDPLGDALRVRRAPREAGRQVSRPRERIAMSEPHSDALVFFGATGDLAYKKIFPALQAMVKRGHLDVPVIGVAKAGWNLEQLQGARPRQPREARRRRRRGGVREALRPAALRRRRLRRPGHVPGAAQGARRRAASGALPRHPAGRCSGRSSSSSPPSGCTAGARVIVEKPFGHDLASARELNRDPARHVRRGRTSSASTTTSASGRCTTWCSSASPTRSSSRSGTASYVEERADHHGRGLRRPGPRRLLRPDRHRSAT